MSRIEEKLDDVFSLLETNARINSYILQLLAFKFDIDLNEFLEKIDGGK